MKFQQINLYQPMFRRQEKIFSAVTIAQSLAVLLLGFAVFYAYSIWNVNNLRKEVANHERMQAEALARLETLSATYPLRKKSKLLESRIQVLQQELQAKQALLGILDDTRIGNTQGFSAHFSGLARQRIDGLWLRGVQFSKGGQQVGIFGSTLQPELVPQFIQKLGGENAFRGAEFRTFTMQRVKGDVARVDFTLQSQLQQESAQ